MASVSSWKRRVHFSIVAKNGIGPNAGASEDNREGTNCARCWNTQRVDDHPGLCLLLHLVELPALGAFNDNVGEFRANHALDQDTAARAALDVNVTAAHGHRQ
jgi:hypothetical protein